MVLDSSDSRSSSSSSASLEVSTPAMPTATAEEELEAAEALADMALSAMREDSSVFQCRRASKRVKSESPPPNEVAESSARCAELSPECNQQCGEADRDRTETGFNLEEKDCKSLDTSLGCGKSRRNLTEEEKEARRIRRILANRESARQTIRRRQALSEELTKKAADLSLENDNLRRDMEIALKEYQMYETTNKELKDQMAKLAKPAVSQASQFLPYNHQNFAPFFWPGVSLSENPALTSHIPQSGAVLPPNIHFLDEHYEQEILSNTSTPMTPHYIYPYPWFFSHPHPGTSIQSPPFDPQRHEQELPLDHFPSVKPVKCEPHEARITEDLNELPMEISPERDDNGKAASPEKYKDTTCNTRHETGLQNDSTLHFGESMDDSRTSPEKHERLAAAEARKRRKEVTKMKNLHGRHYRMHY